MKKFDSDENSRIIHHIVISNDSFFVKKNVNSKNIIFGKFKSLKEAEAATTILIKNNWKISEVMADPLVKYDDEFWIFNLDENRLIFETKFSSYEKAVEYMEINPRCNDYHNDIFKNSLKKNGNTNRFEFSNEYSSDNEVDEYIYNVEDKFIVRKSNKRDSKVYGIFNSRDEALAARKALLEFNWKISGENEIVFYNNIYWAFDVYYGILSFKGKSDSYEDAMDMDSPVKQDSNEIIIESILEKEEDDKPGKNVKPKRKVKKRKKSTNSLKRSRLNKHISRAKTDNSFKRTYTDDDDGVWKPAVPNFKLSYRVHKIFVNKSGKSDKDAIVFEFHVFKSKTECYINGDKINWDDRNNLSIIGFPEFHLISDILERTGLYLSRISDNSSIYFHDGYYYKIYIVNSYTLVFDKFKSYSQAEKTRLMYNTVFVDQLDYNYPSDINKRDSYYELSKFKNGELFKTVPMKSLEEVKAIRDILVYSDWDFKIFDKFDLFYLNGICWKLSCRNNIIRLVDKF